MRCGVSVAFYSQMAMPRHYTPMLATTRQHPFNNADWQWEVKWEGYRMMAYLPRLLLINRVLKVEVFVQLVYELRFE